MSSTLTPEEARHFLVGHAGLRAVVHPTGAEGIRALLEARRCIQLDPLEPLGTNADLVALARLDGVKRGDIYRDLHPGHAFEHFAKERCILPASMFPAYRDQAVETPWWRSTARMKRVPPEALEAVHAEVKARGPLTPQDLSDHGAVDAINWHGWQSTSKMGTMALEVLWLRCRVVVCGRRGRNRVFDVPERVLPQVAAAKPTGNFFREGLLNRVEAMGLMPRTDGPWWSMLNAVRKTPLADELIDEGLIEQVQIPGKRTLYLAPAGFRDRTYPDDDGRMRIIGPLDPLIWCRPLIKQAFGFEYVWEVYKPEDKRRWGWYVCPLLHEGRLVGRFEGHIEGGEVVVDTLWKEDGVPFDEAAFKRALERHGAACTPRAPASDLPTQRP
ncbi:MAG: DNA glycosylase AlkZ-like family protein [Bradymonadia bacterium]